LSRLRAVCDRRCHVENGGRGRSRRAGGMLRLVGSTAAGGRARRAMGGRPWLRIFGGEDWGRRGARFGCGDVKKSRPTSHCVMSVFRVAGEGHRGLRFIRSGRARHIINKQHTLGVSNSKQFARALDLPLLMCFTASELANVTLGHTLCAVCYVSKILSAVRTSSQPMNNSR
jgi:hypothetical protein